MLFKKTSNVNLTKAYLSPLPNGGIADLAKAIEICLADCIELPKKFSINYGEESEYSFLNSRFSRLRRPEELEHLDVLDDRGRIVLFIYQPFRYLKLDVLVYECAVVTPEDDSFRTGVRLIEMFSKAFVLHTAYSRTLNSAYLPTSESRINKTLFGNLVVKVNRADKEWLIIPKNLSTGAAKGIYPLNFWTEQTKNKLTDMGLIPREFQCISNNIYQLNVEQRSRMLNDFKEFRQYFHFGDS